MDCLWICFFFKQKTAYEMRISDWSSDVCSSDLRAGAVQLFASAWQSTIRAACRLPAERTLFLHYDEIAGDPVSALAKVLHHLGDGNPIADPAAVARVMGSYSKAGAAEPFRSEERRVGKECVSTCRSRWSPSH